MSVKQKKNSGPKKGNYIFGNKELQTKIDNFSIKLDTPEEKQSVIDLLLNVLSIYSNDSTFRLDSINGFEQKMNEIISTLTNILINGEEYLDSDSNINIEHPRLKPIIDILDNYTGDVKNFFSELNKLGYIKNASKELQELQKSNLLVTKKSGGANFFDKFKSKNDGGHHFFIGVGKNHRFTRQSQGLLMFTFDINDKQNILNTQNFNNNQKSFFDEYDREIKEAFDKYEETVIDEIEKYKELHKTENPRDIAEISITKKINEITEKYKRDYDISLPNLKINGSLRLIKKNTTTINNNGDTRTTSEFIIGPFDADLELNMSTHKIANFNCSDFNLSLFKLFCGQQKFFDNGIIDVSDKSYCFRNKRDSTESAPATASFSEPIIFKDSSRGRRLGHGLQLDKDDVKVGDFIIKNINGNIFEILRINNNIYSVKNIFDDREIDIDQINLYVKLSADVAAAAAVTAANAADKAAAAVKDAAADAANAADKAATAKADLDEAATKMNDAETAANDPKKIIIDVFQFQDTYNKKLKIYTNALNKKEKKNNIKSKMDEDAISKAKYAKVTADIAKTIAKDANVVSKQYNWSLDKTIEKVIDSVNLSSIASFSESVQNVVNSVPNLSNILQPLCTGDLSYFLDFKKEFDSLDTKLRLCSKFYSSEFDLNSDFIAKPVEIIDAINSLKLSTQETELLNKLIVDYAWEYIEDTHVSDQIMSQAEGRFRVFPVFNADNPTAFFSNSCEIIYNSDKTYFVIPRDIKMPSNIQDINVNVIVNGTTVKTPISKLIFRDGNVFFDISTHTTSTTSKTVSKIGTNNGHNVNQIIYNNVAIIIANRSPVNLQFFSNEIINFKINNENDEKFKNIQDSNRNKLFIKLHQANSELSVLLKKKPHNKDGHDTTIIGIFIFLCILYAFYLFVIAPIFFLLFGWGKTTLLVYLIGKIFGSQLPYGNFFGLGNFFQMGDDISTNPNGASTLVMHQFIVTMFGISFAVFSGFFKLVNQTYAVSAAPYATKYLFSSFITSENQLHKLLHDHANKIFKTKTLKNFNESFNNNYENLTAAQMLSIRKGYFLDDYDNKIKSINGADLIGLLKIVYYSIFTTGLWKIVLVFLIMALLQKIDTRPMNLEGVWGGVWGGKLSRKAKNNKKTKKPRILKRAKKTLRHRKISGGGNTVDIENMKNLTGITYFLLSAFSGYYTSLSSIQVPKFMSEAVKVFLKL